MSALPQIPGFVQDPSSPHGDGSAGTRNADPHSPQDQNIDIGSLIRTALVNGAEPGAAGAFDSAGAASGAEPGEHIYDGHVPLALDAEFLPAIDTTLDLLTTSTDLFDVPVADFGSSVGDATDA